MLDENAPKQGKEISQENQLLNRIASEGQRTEMRRGKIQCLY